MNRAIALLLLTMICAAAAPAFAADPPPAPPPKTLQELDEKLAQTFKDAKVPGANIAIIENGQVVLAKGYGLADVGANKPVTPDTIFRAGSISKGLVGIAVMMLVEEGKLDLNAKLADLAPEIKFNNPWEATDPVRLTHLMEHTTGFDDINFHHYLFDGKNMPLLKAIELYGPYTSRWKPGTLVSYCNSAPVIAGYIVEKASGMSWQDFTRTRIFEPLGMTSATWDPTPEMMARIAKSYATDGTTEQPYIDIPGKPAGSLNVTPSDLAKLALMLANRGTYEGHQLLKPESVARLETPQTTWASRAGLKDGYGFGNMAMAREKAVFHGHDGGIDGFVSLYGYEPEHHAGFVAMVNAPQGDALKAADLIYGYLQRDWPTPTPATIKPAAAELESLAGFYQSISPRQQMLAPLQDILNWQPVKVENGGLVVNGTPRLAVAPNTFQKTDRVIPNIVFVNTPDGPIFLAATDASRRVPMWEIAWKAAYAALLAFTFAMTVIFFVVWMPSYFLGRLSERGGVLVRLVPTVALLTMAAFPIVLVAALSDGSWSTLEALGTQSTTAKAIYYLSLVYPIIGALGLLIALVSGGAPRWVRTWAVVVGALTLGAAAYLYPYGWVGLQTWQ